MLIEISFKKFYFDNAALVAFKRVENAFDGAAQEARFSTEEDMQDYMKDIRKEEFLKGVDRGLEQAKNGQRLDAIEAVKDMSKELKAGYRAINEMHASSVEKMAANS